MSLSAISAFFEQSMPIGIVGIIVYLAIISRDMKHIKEILSNHITDTNKKIDALRIDTNNKIDVLRTDTNKNIDVLRTDMSKNMDVLRTDMNVLRTDMKEGFKEIKELIRK